MKSRVELSLRLSQVDPEAAKKLRMKKERRKKKVTKLTSDGESVELNERFRILFFMHADVKFDCLSF